MIRGQKAMLRTCVAACALLLGTLPQAWAQDATDGDDNVDSLNQVVVEGDSALNQATILTTRSTNVDIARVQLEDAQDVGRLDPTISYNASNDSFVIRGLDRDRVLTTVDGIRVPWLFDSARGINGGNAMFDFNALSGLDVIRGSDSSIHGSGALGGVVAVRTLDPEDLLSDEKDWAGLTRASYDSANRSWRIDQAFALRFDQTSLLFQGGYAKGKERENQGEVGGFGAVRTDANPGKFDQNNLMFKAYHLVDLSHRFGFTFERFDRDNELRNFIASTTTYRPGSTLETTRQRRERASLSYDYNGGAFLDEAHATLYWQRQKMNEISDAERLTAPIGEYIRDSKIEEVSYGGIVSGFKSLDVNDVTHGLRFSADIRASSYEQFAGGRDNCPPPPHFPPYVTCRFIHINQSDAPDIDSIAFGLSLEDEIAFFDRRLRVTPGVRFDYYKHEPQKTASFEAKDGFDGYPDENSASRVSPKLRVEWDAADNVTLYAQWAQGFRAPNVNELYHGYINPGMYYAKGRDDLKPETSNGFDIGARFGNEDLGGSLSIFHNRYKNFIDTIDLGPGLGFMLARQEYVNRDKVRITGVEATGHWAFAQGWRTHFGFTYARGKDERTGEYLNSVPALKAVTGLGYAREHWGADAILTAVAKRDRVENGADFAKTPSYTLFDLTGWWEPLGEKGPRLQAGVYNLFDKKYWDAVSMPATGTQPRDFYTEPGRSFKISLTQKF